MGKNKGEKVLHFLIIAVIAFVFIWNFLVLPSIIFSRNMEVYEGVCSDFCKTISGSTHSAVEYNRAKESVSCYCSNEGNMLGKTAYPFR